VAFDVATLASLLSEGRSRRDTEDTVIEELGYSAALWNGSTHSQPF
jgi:hypothetical protein